VASILGEHTNAAARSPPPPTLQVLNKGEVEEKEKGDGEQKEVEEKQK
jgi:hypothetical protein